MKGRALYVAVSALVLLLFLLLPQIDLVTSGLFYTPGKGFVLKHCPPIEILYRSIPWIVWGVLVVVAFAGAWLFLLGRPLRRLDRRALCFVALSIALGPGLLVNTVLKDHWGRARPVQIERFGGAHQFTPAPLPAAECARNCSFASGHAALGYSLLAFAFLLPPGPQRRRGVAAALVFGTLVGLARIAQGAHFLSDVVYAGLLVYGTTALLHWWIVEQDGLAAPWLRRLGRAIRRAATAAGPYQARAWASPFARLGSGTVIVAILVAGSIEILDRPVALFCHAQGPGIHALFELIGQLGLGYGWLTIFGIGFAALHWGGTLPALRPCHRRLRAWSPLPGFLFASIAASGLAADALKLLFGRTRPKLLFDAGLYGFTWFGWRPDLWSFPSGHTATIVSLMAALWFLWPRHILCYMLVGAIIAASRVVVGAHYLSDTLAGSWLAVLTTCGVVLLFVRSGIDLAAARHGQPQPGGAPWPCRHFGGAAAVRGPRMSPAARLRRRRGL